MKVNILICHHKKSEYISNECMIPIQVGRELSSVDLDYCIGDDTGDHISFKNKNWCELTAIYWQWKNVDADYYGLFHYRRILSFKHSHGFFFEESLGQDIIKKYGLDCNTIRKVCKDYDIITSPVDDIYPTLDRNNVMTMYKHYELEHHKDDIDKTIFIIKERYSQYYDSLIEVLDSKKCCFGNIFIMKKEFFFEYCSFVFGVLNELECDLNIDDYDPYQQRVYGFIAERLTNVYMNYIKNEYNKVRIGQLGLIQLCNDRREHIKILRESQNSNNDNLKSNEIINICMSFDDTYFTYAITAFKSLLSNCSNEININVYILCNKKLNNSNRKKFIKIFASKYINIIYRDVNDEVLSMLPLNMGYITIATYYRLLISILLNDIDKVIYLDSDIIFLGDVVELWKISLIDKSIGVVFDELGITQQRRLSMKEGQSYFNAGIVVFDLKNIKLKYNDIFRRYMYIFDKYRDCILYQDQDILNLAFMDDKYIIPLKWNMGTGIFSKNMNENKYTIEDEINALRYPGIIHFTGGYKPWRFFDNHPCSEFYWKYRIGLKEHKLSLKEYINFINHCFFKIRYIGNGSYISFFLFSIKFEIKKSIILKFIKR